MCECFYLIKLLFVIVMNKLLLFLFIIPVRGCFYYFPLFQLLRDVIFGTCIVYTYVCALNGRVNVFVVLFIAVTI